MLIKKGNPEELRCWRTIGGYPQGTGGSHRCMAEKCVAYLPHVNVERKTVTNDVADALLVAGGEWKQITVYAHKPDDQPRVVIERELESGEGSCNALPAYTSTEGE